MLTMDDGTSQGICSYDRGSVKVVARVQVSGGKHSDLKRQFEIASVLNDTSQRGRLCVLFHLFQFNRVFLICASYFELKGDQNDLCVVVSFLTSPSTFRQESSKKTGPGTTSQNLLTLSRLGRISLKTRYSILTSFHQEVSHCGAPRARMSSKRIAVTNL